MDCLVIRLVLANTGNEELQPCYAVFALLRWFLLTCISMFHSNYTLLESIEVLPKPFLMFILWINNQASLHIVLPLTLNSVRYSPESPMLLFSDRNPKDVVEFLSLILVMEMQFWGMYVLYWQFPHTLSITTSHTQQLQYTFIISYWKENIK